MIGIVGSGFGLYGYLPALVLSTSSKIMLKQKSQIFFEKRPELHFCRDRIIWEKDDKTFYQSIETLILCVPPNVQSQIIFEWGKLPNIKKIVLEKPIDVSPIKSKVLIDYVERYNKKIIVGYTFQYTEWGEELIEIVSKSKNSANRIKINWDFKAHHYKNDLQNWKRFHSEGGGVIRFYGIHIIALLTKLGYSEIISSSSSSFSNDDKFLWEIILNGEDLPLINICINSNSDYNRFTIDTSCKSLCLNIKDPFDSRNENINNDNRISVLAKLICSNGTLQDYSFYQQINKLWLDIEMKNTNRVIN